MSLASRAVGSRHVLALAGQRQACRALTLGRSWLQVGQPIQPVRVSMLPGLQKPVALGPNMKVRPDPDMLQKMEAEYNAARAAEAQGGRFSSSKYAGLFGMGVAGIFVILFQCIDDASSDVHYFFALCMRQMHPDTAHAVFMRAASWGFMPRDYERDDWVMSMTPLEGLRFITPVGLAAGFDVKASAPNEFVRLGFGYVEVGPVDCSIADGEETSELSAVADRLALRSRTGQLENVVAIGASLTGRTAADLCAGVKMLGHYADFITIEVADVPAELRSGAPFTNLVAAVVKAASRLPGHGPRIFIRTSPANPPAATIAVCRDAHAGGADGVVIDCSGCHIDDAEDAHSRLLDTIGKVYIETDGKLVIIAGGRFTGGLHALEAIEAGASAVQISKQLLTDGPGVCRRIKSQLFSSCVSAGYVTLADAVGAAHRAKDPKKGRKKNPWRKGQTPE